MEQRVLFAAIISFAIIAGWQYFFVIPMQSAHQQAHHGGASRKGGMTNAGENEGSRIKTREDSILNTASERVTIANKYIAGSINLKGARIDELLLLHYKETIDDSSPDVALLSPGDTPDGYIATFGWLSSDKIELPKTDTLWKSDRAELVPEKPISLKWINNAGVKFTIEIALDNEYMFTIKQLVENGSDTQITISNYATINRTRGNVVTENMILHEGAIGVTDGKLHELTFADMEKNKKDKLAAAKGWLGFSDKYWLTAFIPTQAFTGNLSSYNSSVLGQKKFQIDLIGQDWVVDPGQAAEIAGYQFFAGAKSLSILDRYEKLNNIPLFDHAVDFGILYFITKPIFLLLNYLYGFLGNFGVAIMLLTVIIKGALFPLAHKGFRSMNRLKELQPQLVRIKDSYKDQPAMFQKAMIDLYKKEKVSPVSGCLPIILQMPIFFALYKVLYVTIEMRHAPFILWIHDLSAPDSTTLFNLFGMINWQPPAFLMIGVLPILMSLTIFIQQKFNPQPADPVQAKVMQALPVVFLFMFSSFPSGLLLYWTWSNILSILQQWLIKKIEG